MSVGSNLFRINYTTIGSFISVVSLQDMICINSGIIRVPFMTWNVRWDMEYVTPDDQVLPQSI